MGGRETFGRERGQRDACSTAPPPTCSPGAQHRAFAARLADRQNLTIPSEDPDYGDLGQAFPPWPAPAKDAILQPPKPEIQPSERIPEHAQDHDLDMEAAN